MPLSTYFILVCTTFFWGGTFIAGRLLAESIPPMSASFLRFLIASITLLAILLLGKEKLTRPSSRQIPALLMLGLTGVFAYNVFFFTGLSYITAGRASLIIATTPMIIAICSTLLYREPITVLKVGGIMVSLTGALFVISNGHPAEILSGGFGPGEKSLAGCVLSWTAYTIIGRRVLQKLSPLVAVFYSSAAGAAMLLIPAINEGLITIVSEATLSNWISLGYLGICGTAIGFTWYYKGIRVIGTTRAGIFINLVPLFALLLSWLILSETIKISVFAGGALVLFGVFITNKPAHQK